MPLNKIATNESGVINKNHDKNNLFQSLGCTTVLCRARHGALDVYLLYHHSLGRPPCSLTTERLACNGAQKKGMLPFCLLLHFKHGCLKLANFGGAREKDKDREVALFFFQQ